MTIGQDQDGWSRVLSWGMAQEARCQIRRPADLAGARAAIAEARSRGLPLAQRGGGNSYGDAAMKDGALLLDWSGMNRIRSFDPATGLMEAEPGVTIREAWQRSIPAGFWLPVVPGTMHVTFGGAAAMNIHGKNNFKLGTFGKHVQRFGFLLADGREVECSPKEGSRLFHAAIGGFGVLGCFTSITLKLKKVHSGLLEVEPRAVNSFRHAFELFDELEKDADYLVGWHDGMRAGGDIGRGLLHRARDLAPGEDADPAETLRLDRQCLPDRFFGVVPRSWLWAGLWFFLNDPGMRLVNSLKLMSGARHARAGTYRQAHAAYHFLLDYVPDWKRAYRPGGLIQVQSFVPRAEAAGIFEEIIRLTHRHGHPPYLCVTKRHLPDPFLMTHAVDGYSLALDIKVTAANRAAVWKMAHAIEDLVVAAGGRFYFAKDSVMRPETLQASYPPERVREFLELKRELDPENLFRSDLYDRVFQARDGTKVLEEKAERKPGRQKTL